MKGRPVRDMGNIQFYGSKVLFVDNKVAMDPACCCGGCAACTGETPDSFSVDLGGFADGILCSDCHYLNDTTFILTKTGPCEWQYCTNDWECGSPLCVTLTIDGDTGDILLSVDLDLTVIAAFRASPGSSYDCCALSGYSLTLDSYSTDDCDASAATATITGLCPALMQPGLPQADFVQ